MNEKEQYEEAARRCEEVYEAEGDARAGWQTALALFNLGREDDVLAWVDRLEKDGKIHPGAWGVSALVHQQRGDFDASNRDYRRDLELHRAAGDHLSAADTLYRLSHNAWRQSRYREAFLLANETLEEAGKAQDRDLEIRSTGMLYSVLYGVGDLEGARQALEVTGRLTGDEDPAARAKFLANRGGVLVDEGKLALARRDLEQALELGAAGKLDATFFRRVQVNLTALHLDLGSTDDIARAARHLEEAWKHSDPNKPKPASLLYYRARVDLARKRPAEALRSLEVALGQDPAPDWAWDLEYQRGRAEETLGRLDAAEAAYERSIGVVEAMRRELAFDDLKSWLLDRKRQPFEALFLLQARSDRAEEALATVERAQARTFLDAFLHANSSARAPNTPKDKPWSSASLQRIEGLESLLPAMGESPVASLQPIGQVLTAFGNRHGLVYFEAGEDLWLLTVHGQRIRLHSPVPAEEVRRLGGRFLAHPEDSRTAERLGEMLLPPGSLPERGSAIHLVADGILGNLPFAALRRGGRYLVEDHPVLFLPSLGALAALESRRGEAPGPPLVLADSRGDLPAAAAEGRQVAGRLGSPFLVGRTAVSGELRKASRAGTLHLALHTGPGPRGAWLQLADRQVSASEIVAGRIGPRLVVLASCSSGVRPGRQMWGSLGAAFLAAGSRAVLASLWSVEDERAREFVLRFYAEGGAADPSGALARTQRVAIAEGRSPMFWAPFVLIGSDRPLADIQ